MVSYDFSGEEVYKGMANSSVGWYPDRVTGDHIIMRWEAPDHHDSDSRMVSIPLHDSLSIGTLRDIAKDAGMNDFDEFCKWIASNC